MRRLERRGLPCLREPSGFTLIELVIVMAILVMVLTMTYRMILDCLDAERTIDKLTIPEKVGEGILALFRSDLSGTIWRHSGTRVFFVTDNGSAKAARDEIRFLSTVEPTPVEDATQGSTAQVSTIRTITGLAYFLKQGGGIDGVPAYTLFRKEIIDFTDENPLEAPGTNYEVYDKIAYLSIECFDSYESFWSQVWDSEAMINEELADLEAETEANAGIAAVGQRDDDNEGKNPRAGTSAKGGEKSRDPKSGPRDPSTSRRAAAREQNALTRNAPGADPTLGEGQNAELLPPAAVPSAVRIEIGIYAGQGGKIERDGQGTPIVRTYATIVPILAAQRVKVEPEENDPLLDGGEIAGATDPEGGPGGSSGGTHLGGRGQPRAGQPARGAAGRGGRARPGPGGTPLPRLPGLPGGAR